MMLRQLMISVRHIFSELAREAMRWTQSVIAKHHVEWLNALSYELRLPEFFISARRTGPLFRIL